MANHRFDCIISDNRYGLRHRDAKSILLTHQVMIKMPVWLKLFEYPVYLISRLLISRFDECWIPDFRDSPGLSGDLSHKYPLPKNSKFIGPLSRFNYPIKLPESCGSSIVVLISGPEPQRSIFEKIILKQLQLIDKPAFVVSGKPESAGEFKKMKNITLYPHLDTPTLEGLISTAEAVICRSGYSSLMDLYKLGSKALLIPTPGQTEQIYLAELHQNLHNFISRNQSELFLPEDIKHLIQCKRMSSATTEEDLLKHAIARLVNNK